MTEYNELFMSYLDCSDPVEKAELKNQLFASGMQPEEIADLEKIYAKLDAFEVPEPGTEMTTHFYATLERHVHNQAKHQVSLKSIFKPFFSTPAYKFAAIAVYSALLVFISYQIGKQPKQNSGYEQQLTSMTMEIQEMKNVMAMALLNQNSAAQRIKGVSTINSMKEVDTTLIYALLQTLSNDPSESVRLLALQSLQRFSDNPIVRQGLVHAISSQQSPVILLTLADIMVSLHEKNSVQPFRQVLEQTNLENDVRETISKSILTLI